MVYCIVEGKSDAVILAAIFKQVLNNQPKIIESNGFPSMPAVARTILSFAEETDKVMIVCDQDSFDNESYQMNMLGFLLRGAMNNPQFKLVTFNPNIDVLIPNEMKVKGWKTKTDEQKSFVIEHMESVMTNETVQEIVDFIEK